MTHRYRFALSQEEAVRHFDQHTEGFHMTKANLRLVSPRAVIGTVPPRRRPNADLRTREYLTETEVERLIKAAKANRHGQRDATMILLAFRHGLRAAEIVDLRWDQVELGRNACLHVRRVKNGIPTTHPLQGNEMRALRALKRNSPFVFTSERGAPFTQAGFAKMIARLGVEAKFKFGVHPHMLRHACGYSHTRRPQLLAAVAGSDTETQIPINVAALLILAIDDGFRCYSAKTRRGGSRPIVAGTFACNH